LIEIIPDATINTNSAYSNTFTVEFKYQEKYPNDLITKIDEIVSDHFKNENYVSNSYQENEMIKVIYSLIKKKSKSNQKVQIEEITLPSYKSYFEIGGVLIAMIILFLSIYYKEILKHFKINQ